MGVHRTVTVTVTVFYRLMNSMVERLTTRAKLKATVMSNCACWQVESVIKPLLGAMRMVADNELLVRMQSIIYRAYTNMSILHSLRFRPTLPHRQSFVHHTWSTLVPSSVNVSSHFDATHELESFYSHLAAYAEYTGDYEATECNRARYQNEHNHAEKERKGEKRKGWVKNRREREREGQ